MSTAAPTRPGTEDAPPPSTADSPSGLNHRQILVVMSGLMLGMFLAALDQTIVATALPTIAGDFHRSDLYSWVVTAYLLTSTASTPLYGKAGDLYGRKRVFQFAIVLFLIGSAMCGASQNMYELIAFRGLQGLGAGGLISLVLAIIGDVIPPRQRGRYQGYFAATFGVASVVGPLLGGFLVDQLNWRWVFYVNLPLGVIALIVTNRVLRLPFRTRHAQIDWWGSLLFVSSIAGLVLGISTGGHDYAWTSWQMGVMLGGFLVLGTGFVIREHYATEPLLPLRLFKGDVFSVASLMAFIVGAAMFGVLSFIPQFMQLVRGDSATKSGLLLLPMLVGLMGASITAGKRVSKTGHYRAFPIIGTATVTIGLILLTTIHINMNYWQLAAGLFVLGAGIGMFMQVLVLATQNSVPISDLGVATSANTFFRSLGGAIGAAAFGALLTNRLTHELPAKLAAAHATLATNAHGVNGLVGAPDSLKLLPAAAAGAIRQGYTDSLHTVLVAAVPIGIIGFLVSFFLREVNLRAASGLQAQSAAETPGQPIATAASGAPEGAFGADGAVDRASTGAFMK
jgi:EmrB/QacA subfamily drug resistance transporter